LAAKESIFGGGSDGQTEDNEVGEHSERMSLLLERYNKTSGYEIAWELA
jgi:hypothetical protein